MNPRNVVAAQIVVKFKLASLIKLQLDFDVVDGQGQ